MSIVVTVCFVITHNAISNTINLKGNAIEFRDYYNAALTTNHFGDLTVSGGQYLSDWGWLNCTRIYAQASDVTNIMSGNLQVYGTKAFVQPHPSDSTKEIVYTCMEAGEALTVVRGVASTINGKITITLPEHYSMVTSDEEAISVILSPEGKPALLYVVSKSKQAVTIAVKQEDYEQFGDIQFSYQVTGVRDGFENIQPIQDIFSKPPVSEKRAILNQKSQKIAEKKFLQEKKAKEEKVQVNE